MPRIHPRKCLLSAGVLIGITLLGGIILGFKYNRDDNDPNQNDQRIRHENSRSIANQLSSYNSIPNHSDSMLTTNHSHTTSSHSSHGTLRTDSKLSEWVSRFPRYMIIGFGKTGTKALYEALKLHPKLNGPYKEQRFFSRHFTIGVKSYISAFPPPPKGGHTIEKSPDYIIVREVPKRILSTVNSLGIDPASLKFVVVLRDPVDRAMSEYLEWNVQRLERHKPRLPPFKKMIFDKSGKINSSIPYINTSCYIPHIKHWLRYFPKEQMCFVDGDRFVSNPYAEIHQLEECMGLSHYFTEQNFVYDKQKGFYCFRGNQNSSKTVCMNGNKGRKHPDLSKTTLNKLHKFFKPFNAQMMNVTGRSFQANH